MKRDQRLYLNDILESIELIEDYLKGVSKREFRRDIMLQDAVCRRLEIIGEAVKKLSKGIKSGHPQIPWKKIAGLRDVLIHEYFGINVERIWLIIKKDLPELKLNLQDIWNSLSDS